MFPMFHIPPLLTRFTALLSSPAGVFTVVKLLYFSPYTCLNKWTRYDDFDLSDEQWRNIFLIPFFSFRESKVQYFQFRFIYRIIGTNNLLHRMQIKDNRLCIFCSICEETIDHLFWGCEIISSFILDIKQSILRGTACPFKAGSLVWL